MDRLIHRRLDALAMLSAPPKRNERPREERTSSFQDVLTKHRANAQKKTAQRQQKTPPPLPHTARKPWDANRHFNFGAWDTEYKRFLLNERLLDLIQLLATFQGTKRDYARLAKLQADIRRLMNEA
ncbi:hypothetical protein GOP80_06150 [Planococcaceae bacterium Storch 2/2-2]|nr:hypothetical protein [Planococcaceae bacterium Storch 2/2-2]